MRKYFIITSVILIASSCSQTINVDSGDSITVKQDSTLATQTTPFKNPVLIFGSSFGSFFQSFYKLGKYEEMIKFTSKKTIDKYGKEKLLKMYSLIDFAFPLKLKNLSTDSLTGDIQLTYETSIVATTKIFRMKVIIENDSAKLLSCDLEGFPEN